MIAVKGIYQGGDTVKLDPITINFSDPYEVIVTFVTPISQKENTENNRKRQKAFENFIGYRGILPADFDYKNELNDYREERYGHIN